MLRFGGTAMTIPLVGKSFLTALLALALAAPCAANSAAGAGKAHVGNSGAGFTGFSGPVAADFARSLSRISLEASLLGSPGLSGFPSAPGAITASPEAAAAPRASADQVISFLATSPGETETEFKARRAVLGALWQNQAFADGLIGSLRALETPEGREAADALTELTRDYRPLVASQKARIARDIPALARLEKLGSFDEISALFDASTRRAASETKEGAVLADDGQPSLFTPEQLSGRLRKSDPAALAAASEKGPPAVAGELAAAPVAAPKGMMGMVGKAKGVMKEHRVSLTGYLGLIGVGAPVLGSILMAGDTMSNGAGVGVKAAAALAASHAALGPLGLLLLQAFVILGVGKLMGILLAKVGQPSVIGQVLGGLLLGPSALGLLFPGMMGSIFPSASLAFLDPLSQFGLIFFMFIVGLELDTKLLKKQGGVAGLVSHASIIFPFVLGAALALVLFTGFAPAGIPFHIFALFMGISMSITAFPVLASILKERKLMKTPLGSVALTSAAIDDATAWPLLAFVVALAASGSGMAALPMLALTVAFVAVMFGVVRPLLANWVNKLTPEQSENPASAVIPVLVVILSALATEMIGIHALFGAFIAGVIIPRQAPLRHHMEKWLGNFSGLILLPIFFAMTGLRTELGLIAGPMELLVTAGIILVAMAGKLGGAAAAAKWSGLGWRDSLSIGALMNTRGLMELIVLNIGYNMGILSPTLFAMLVVMAVVTTIMTAPLLSLINRGRTKADSDMITEART